MRYCCVNWNPNRKRNLNVKGISLKAQKKGKEENLSVCGNKLTWRSLRDLNFNKFLRAAQMCLQWQGFSALQLSGESRCWSCFCRRYDQRGEFSTETNGSAEKAPLCVMSSLAIFPRRKQLFYLMQKKWLFIQFKQEEKKPKQTRGAIYLGRKLAFIGL